MKNKKIKSRWLYILFSLIVLFLFYSFQKNKDTDAEKFLNSLDDSQKEKVLLDFRDLFREEWHFFPIAMLPRPGLAIKKLNETQKELFLELLRNNLSEGGYDKTMQIMELENVLAEMDKDTVFRDAGLYNIAFYGKPGDETWSWSFEGHHVSLNFTIVGDKVSMVPRFLGANPAEVRSGDQKGLRVLDKEEDIAFRLLKSMTEEQKKKTVFQEHSLWELATSTSSQVGPLRPVGIKVIELRDQQQAILFELIYEYLSTMPETVAKARMAKLQKEDLLEIRFGWAGATVIDKPHYYRIQGKTFLIEFDNSQNNANHIHTVWRDFDGDFGRDLIREHHLRDHQEEKKAKPRFIPD